jgi:hypothetical protein
MDQMKRVEEMYIRNILASKIQQLEEMRLDLAKLIETGYPELQHIAHRTNTKWTA